MSVARRKPPPGAGRSRAAPASSLIVREKARRSRLLITAVRESSLSIVLFALFVMCISAQSFAGWRLQNETLAAHAQRPAAYWHFLSTGAFIDGLASNWQATVLQLGSLIVFSSFL